MGKTRDKAQKERGYKALYKKIGWIGKKGIPFSKINKQAQTKKTVSQMLKENPYSFRLLF